MTITLGRSPNDLGHIAHHMRLQENISRMMLSPLLALQRKIVPAIAHLAEVPTMSDLIHASHLPPLISVREHHTVCGSLSPSSFGLQDEPTLRSTSEQSELFFHASDRFSPGSVTYNALLRSKSSGVCHAPRPSGSLVHDISYAQRPAQAMDVYLGDTPNYHWMISIPLSG